MLRRSVLALGAGALAAPQLARAADLTGVSADEIRIGNTMSYSGPASAYGVIGRTEAAFFRMVNAQGGVAGRRVNFITYDDGYSPPKTVEQTRRLVEQDKVAFIFQGLGTAANSAVQRYLNQRRVPQLFVATGADKWADPKEFPWTIGWQPSYRTEAQIYTKHLLEAHAGAKVALLYQNDDFGKDYVTGVKDVLGARFDAMVTPITYEVTDATIDSQVVQMHSAGAQVLITAATPKFAAQTIRKVYDIGWRPAAHYLTNVSISAATVMNPAGAEKGVGVMTSAYLKDPTDPGWADDAGMNEWRGFMRQWMPDGDMTDASIPYAYGASLTMLQVLKQCGQDLSRENVMAQVANLKDLVLPTIIPGIKVNTSPTNFHPMRQMQLQRWTGTTWHRFGNVIEGANV